jgi:GT2 family glycosyltransferase
MSSFAIGIPTLNRADLLVPALVTYLRDYTCDIFIVDNGRQDIPAHERIHMNRQDSNLGVAKSWNLLCCEIYLRGYPAALILNDDIEFGRPQEQIELVMEQNPGRMLNNFMDWCAFLLPQSVVQALAARERSQPPVPGCAPGWFDENFFPAYYEDADYRRRLSVSGLGFVKTRAMDPVVHRDNMTGKKDSSIHLAAHKNKQYFLSKWGGPPLGERYAMPFNASAKKKKGK